MAIPASRTRMVLSSCYWSSYLKKMLSSSAARGFSSNAVPSQLERVGFIGLGNMGFHMANNLIKAGYKLTVNDMNRSVSARSLRSAHRRAIIRTLYPPFHQSHVVRRRIIVLALYLPFTNLSDQTAMKKFSDCGISTVETPFKVAESSDVIITMLPSSSHVLAVYAGQNGLLHGGSQVRPWLFIDSSTIDPHTSRKLSMNISQCLLKEKKGNADSPFMLDAPVSGGVPGAAVGTLTFMVGGIEDAYLAAKPLFLAMGKNTVYCGGPGNGADVKLVGFLDQKEDESKKDVPVKGEARAFIQELKLEDPPQVEFVINSLGCIMVENSAAKNAAKICNNLAMAVSMLGVSEALALGQGLGIAANTLTNIFNSSSARCWSSDCYNPVPGVMEGVPSSRGYDGGFSSKLMAKDLMLAKASAEEIQQKCPLTSEALNIYMEMCSKGYESKDFSCVFKHYYAGSHNM